MSKELTLPYNLVGLISNQICHDLATPLSALGLNLEILGDNTSDSGQNLEPVHTTYRQLLSVFEGIRLLYAAPDSALTNKSIVTFFNLHHRKNLSLHMKGETNNPILIRLAIGLVHIAIESSLPGIPINLMYSNESISVFGNGRIRESDYHYLSSGLPEMHEKISGFICLLQYLAGAHGGKIYVNQDKHEFRVAYRKN